MVGCGSSRQRQSDDADRVEEGRLVRFVDDGGAISLPPVSISALLDYTNLCSLTRARRLEARPYGEIECGGRAPWKKAGGQSI